MKNERNTRYRLGQEHWPCFASIRGGIETRPTSCSTIHCCVTLGGDSTSLSLTLTCKVGLVAAPVSRVGETHQGLYVWHSLTEHGLHKPCSQVRGACIVNRTLFQELGGKGGRTALMGPQRVRPRVLTGVSSPLPLPLCTQL